MCSFPLKLCCNARMYFMWFFRRNADIRLHTELWKQCPTWALHPLNYSLDQGSLIKYHWSLVSRILHDNFTIQVYYTSRFTLGSIIVDLNCTFFTLYSFDAFLKQLLILKSHPKLGSTSPISIFSKRCEAGTTYVTWPSRRLFSINKWIW